MRGWTSSSARSSHGARATIRPCRTPSAVESFRERAPQTVCAAVSDESTVAVDHEPRAERVVAPDAGADADDAEVEPRLRAGGGAAGGARLRRMRSARATRNTRLRQSEPTHPTDPSRRSYAGRRDAPAGSDACLLTIPRVYVADCPGPRARSVRLLRGLRPPTRAGRPCPSRGTARIHRITTRAAPDPCGALC